MMVVEPVAPGMVETVWPEVEPLLLDAMEHGAGELSLGDIRRRVSVQGDLYLLVGRSRPQGATQAVFVVADVHYSQFRALRVVIAAGEPMAEWLPPLVKTLEARCAIIGAEQIEYFGRPGFARALKDWADHTYTVMIRKVRHGRKRDQDPDRTAA